MPGDGRRLAAIMFTDIVGYTAITQKNEALALSLLNKHNELIRPTLLKHNGTEVKTIGDSFLVEFPSALAATECSIELQKALHEYNENATEKVLVRVGLHVGDVVEQKQDVFGDAVNIASRIEGLAKGGEIFLSEQVYAQVRNKIPFKLSRLEPRELKNVSFPISIYKLELPWDEEKIGSGKFEKNRLAVLPFVSISPDSSDEYFADGLTEELISKLSLTKGLKVIARTSVMKYKGKEKGISEIGRELGVGTLVEGSVRKAGNRIRVTVQVIDANNEEHLWASSYDKNLEDIFAVQVEIASKISEALLGSIPFSKSPSFSAGETKNVVAYTYYLKGKQLLGERTDTSIRQALELFMRATKLDPAFARAFVSIGRCYSELGLRSYISNEESVSGMRSAVTKALELDPNLDEGHSLLSYLAWNQDDYATTEIEARRAIELNPNLSEAYANLSNLMLTLGYPNSSIELFKIAHQLDPLSPFVIRYLGMMLYFCGKENEALEFWDRNLVIAPFDVHFGLAIYYLGKKEYEKAEEEVRELQLLSAGDFNTWILQGYVAALKGDTQKAISVIEKLEQIFKGGATLERSVGYIKYFLGDMDAFFEAMFRCAETRVLDPLGLRYAPFFEKARQDPRYVKLMRKVGLDPNLKEHA